MNTKFKFNDFEIDYKKPLGEGGFGAVYKATQKNTEKFMQLKDFQLKY